MDAFTRWVHLLAVAVYLGATLAVALVFLPAMEAVEDAALQRRLLARGLRPYNVLSVGALGVLVISGASGLTDMKAMMGPASRSPTRPSRTPRRGARDRWRWT